MAVVKLKEVSIIGKLSELDKVATICGQSNVFHSDNAMNFYADTPDFTDYIEDNPRECSGMPEAVFPLS